MRSLLAAWLLLVAGRTAARAGDAPPERVYVPPYLQDRVLYCNPFDRPNDPGYGRLESISIAVPDGVAPAPGLAGGALEFPESGKPGGIVVRHPEIAPHRPLTVSFWFRLAEPMQPESGFHLATLRGDKGIISTFVRGKGEWCALTQPTRVLQVYYHEGIPNFNGLLGPADFREAAWHHACLVVARGENVRWMVNGTQVADHTVKGRLFRKSDGGTLEIGPNWLAHPMRIDELLILDVALAPDEAAAYAEAVRQLARVGWPSAGNPGREPTPGSSRSDRE